MENRVCLNIDTGKGMFVIPFLDLKKLDRWTAVFENEMEMINALNRILDLSIDIDDIVSIYISGDRYKDRDNSSLSCIKYSADNWNVDSLRDMLSLYLMQDHRRIRGCDVRFVNTSGMIRFEAGMPISDNDIKLAVKVFLNKDYKKQRDMYFMIRDFGCVRVDKPSLKENDNKMNDLSKVEVFNDEFVQYIVELASRGEAYLDKAIEELSKVDLEDISRTLSKTDCFVFDGLNKGAFDDYEEDAYCLVEWTGMSIDELRMLQPGGGFTPSNNGRSK